MDTIAVTSANSITAEWLLPRLKEKGFYTIGLVRNTQEITADETIADWINSEKALRAMKEADVIVHLSGEINAKSENVYRQVNLETTQIVAAAARAGQARRIIFLSYPNADTRQKNWHLRYKAEAENLLLNCGKESVIFRCPAIIDSPDKPAQTVEAYQAKNGKAVQTVGDGRQKMRPIYRGDVVNAILAAIDGGKAGVYELSGAEEFTVDELIKIINRNPNQKISHTPAWLAKIIGRFVPDLSPTMVDILLNHLNSADSTQTYREFNLKPTSLRAVWSVK